jgi:hypothetical protein
MEIVISPSTLRNRYPGVMKIAVSLAKRAGRCRSAGRARTAAARGGADRDHLANTRGAQRHQTHKDTDNFVTVLSG